MAGNDRRLWIGRAVALAAVVAAAVALVGLTTGAWATSTLYGAGSGVGSAPDRARHMELELFPDGRLSVHYGDERLREIYDDGQNKVNRTALGQAVPGVLDGFANACVVAVGLLAAVGVFRRLPGSVWATGGAVVMGALTAVAVLRFELLSALATYSARMNLDFEVHGRALAGRTTIALVVVLVAAAVSAGPWLDRPGEGRD